MTTFEITTTLGVMNSKRPAGTPRIELDRFGGLVLGINVIKLDEDLCAYLGKSTETHGLSTYDMAMEAYGKEVADLIVANLNMSNRA